jgi:hypothetical protein
MKKSETSSTHSPRKRKVPATYSPLPPQEESAIARAIKLSLRKIPSNGEISDDDIDNEVKEGYEETEVDENEADETDEDEYETKWSTDIEDVQVDAFNQPAGPTHSLPSAQNVKNFFELMFNKNIWNYVVKQTNLYAKQQMQLKPDPEWKALGVGELKSWIGCLIAMGLSRHNNIRMYWEPPWRLSIVADRFTRDRFLAIKKYLHLADNSKINDNKTTNPDKLAKLRPFLNLLLQNFRSNYRPNCFLTVDEDMCKFKGRHSMKQYMKAKIIKWGYKIWKLCDSSSGYTLNLDVYTGASEQKAEQGLAYSVVMKMMEGYLDKNHVVVLDNYYTSVPLLLDLLDRSTYACGTIRLKRKFLPKEYGSYKDLDQGESKVWQSGNLVATLWQDKKIVRFLSTCCNPEGDDTVIRRRRGQDPVRLSCPPVVKLYARHMGGVDRSDRMVRTYSVSRQSKKWWFRIFYYLVDTSIANSFILYHNSPNHPKLTELEFVKTLSLALIGSFSTENKVQARPQRKRKKAPIPPKATATNHWPKKTKLQKKCQHCARPGSRGPRSKYVCEACGVSLCIDKCFKLYHTRGR